MLRAIVDKKRIAEIQNLFKKKMLRNLRKSCMLNFGYKGDNTTIKAYHNDDLWFAPKPMADSHHWNVYGLNPDPNRSNDNAVQINVPYKGVNRSRAGLFAEDVKTKQIYLMHRGKVGGGRKGIGKVAFVGWYKGKTFTVDELDGRSSEAFMVTSIRDSKIVDNVTRFVMEVAQFKKENAEKERRRRKIYKKR